MKSFLIFLLIVTAVTPVFALEPQAAALCCLAVKHGKPIPSFCAAQQVDCTQILSAMRPSVRNTHGINLDIPEKFQPDYDRPQQFSLRAMNEMARTVLFKIEKQLGSSFERRDPQHVLRLAEFFHLMPEDSLDPYSTPMEEADIRYFSEVLQHRDKELYPVTVSDLVIRFYWEGVTRLAAADYQLEVVNERRAKDPVKSRGKVSDMATTAMFDKKNGMTIEQARQQGKERYDLARLIEHLQIKGLPAGS